MSYKETQSCSQTHENGNRPQIAVLAIPRSLAPFKDLPLLKTIKGDIKEVLSWLLDNLKQNDYSVSHGQDPSIRSINRPIEGRRSV